MCVRLSGVIQKATHTLLARPLSEFDATKTLDKHDRYLLLLRTWHGIIYFVLRMHTTWFLLLRSEHVRTKQHRDGRRRCVYDRPTPMLSLLSVSVV